MGSSVILPSPGQPAEGADPSFKSGSIPNVVSFGFEKIGPPSPVYVQRDDVLVVEVASIGQPVTVTVTYRLLEVPFPRGGQPTKSGESPTVAIAAQDATIQSGNPSFLYTAATGVTVQFKIALTEGYLLSVTANDNANAQRGQTFVRCFIARGNTAPLAPNAAYVLISDYTTRNHVLGWPGSTIKYPTEGPGLLTTQILANPAAGADWAFTVPAGERWRVQSLQAQLLTSAAVASRTVRVQHVGGGGLNQWQSAAAQTIPAATTAQVAMASGQVTVVTDPTTVNLALPSPFFVVAGDIVRVSTLNLQAGDQWSNIAFGVEEWLDNGNI